MSRAQAGEALAVEGVAATVQRLAVLLGAGVAPANAWLYLRDLPRTDAGAGTEGAVVAAVADAAARGMAIPLAIVDAAARAEGRTADAWRAVAASWHVAIQSGSPLAGCLRDTSETLRQLGQLHRGIDAALAGPRSTARFVGAMPVIGLLFGTMLGFDTLGVLFTTPPGIACLLGGTALSLIAVRWTARLVRKARPRELSPGLSAQLVAIGLAGGGATSRARSLALSAQQEFGVDSSDDDLAAVDRVLALSLAAGIPAAELLRSEAEQLRREVTSAAQARAARLGTSLMIPLGLCVLPAFMLLGVAPMLLAVLSSTVRGIA